MASNAILEQKKKIVEDIVSKIKNSCAGVLVNYQGITVEDDTKLRAELRKNGVEYAVIKNTYLSKAFDQTGLEGLKDGLFGMTAFATCEKDEVAAAKILEKYAADHEDFVLKGGYVDGEVLDEKNVLALAEIPSKDVLGGKLLGSLLSPLYKLAFVLDAAAKKEPESAEAPAEAAPAEAATAEA